MLEDVEQMGLHWIELMYSMGGASALCIRMYFSAEAEGCGLPVGNMRASVALPADFHFLFFFFLAASSCSASSF